MNTVDPAGLGRRILELAKAGSDSVLEISLLKSGEILISKSQEDGKNS
jgi:hypothetical protein